MNENRCVICDEIIPEGRMVCPLCINRYIKIGMILQSNQSIDEEVEQAYNFTKRRECEKENDKN